MRRSRFLILPMGSRGSASTTSTRRAHLYATRCSRQNAITSSGLSSTVGHDDRGDDLAVLVVRQPDHRHLGDVRMADEDRFDLGRVDVRAAGDHEVLAPVDHVEVAVLVEIPDVAERREITAVDRLGELVGPGVAEARDPSPSRCR